MCVLRQEFGKYKDQEWCVKIFIDRVQEYYGVHSEVFVVIYYLVPLMYLNKHDDCCRQDTLPSTTLSVV